MSHAFFASYATLDNSSKHLQKVVLDLRERVRTRLGAANAADVGFFAVYDGILTTQVWEERLSEAARSARVVVLFCSNTYFNSEYCAKEFDIFRRRLGGAAAAPGAGVIVPVIWDVCRLPEAVSRFQASHLAAFPDDYRTQGLLALKRNNTARARYDKAMTALTDIIASAATRDPPLPPLHPPVPFDELLDAFDNPAPYNVRVGALHRDRLRWQLVPALGKTVARIVEAVTASQRLPWRALRIDDDIVAQLEAANVAREAVVLIADDATADASPSADRRRLVDEMAPPNCVVLAGRAEGARPLSPLEAQQRLAQLFPRLTAAGQSAWFASDLGLESLLAERIVKLRMELVNADSATKLHDAGLIEAAAREGVSLSAPALVSGPGGLTS